MTKIYQSPLRVYLALGALALWGLVAGFQLPVSLFPNSSKPTIAVSLGYGDMSASEFLNTYGRNLENQFQSISVDRTEVDIMKATYSPGYVRYILEFKWGADARKALREVQNVMSAFVVQLTPEIRNSLSVNSWSENGGFLAVSFYSPKRSLDELYRFLEPQLVPPSQRVHDVSEAVLWNPSQKEVEIQLDPQKAALLQLFPRDVQNALLPQLGALRGGSWSRD